jgi:hypothetical protein
MAQILGYLALDEADNFQHYAAELRLDRTALANLLIVRELRIGRLEELKLRYDRDLAGMEKTKVVAHQADPLTKAAFKEHAAGFALKPSRAAAIIFRAELTERWLEASMDQKSFDSA